MGRIVVETLDNLAEAAKVFLGVTNGKRKFAFYGKMGAGKTTLIKAICNELGASDLVSSPTFALINEYETNKGLTIYHFDLYRIEDVEELFDIGYEDYFFSDAYLFIEWPEKAEEILPKDICRVCIEENDDFSRIVTFHI